MGGVMDLRGEPDFINDVGVKWWHKATFGGYQVFLTHHPDGGEMFVVADVFANEVVFETANLEEAATKAQMFRLMSSVDMPGGA
jgi:hypothetical protein